MMSLRLTGARLGRDPETREVDGGRRMARATVAHTPRRQDDSGQWVDAGETTWIDIAAWDDMADLLMQCGQGDAVDCEGDFSLREWTDKDGQPRTSPQIRALRTIGIARRKGAGGGQPARRPAQSAGWGTADIAAPF